MKFGLLLTISLVVIASECCITKGRYKIRFLTSKDSQCYIGSAMLSPLVFEALDNLNNREFKRYNK